jgi:hypothetical protein
MSDLWAAIFWLFFLCLLCSVIALAFRTVRPKAKWGTLASAIGLVVSFVFVGLAGNKEEEQEANEMGFLSAADRRSADRASVSVTAAARASDIDGGLDL